MVEFPNKKICTEDCEELRANINYVTKYWSDREKSCANLSKEAKQLLATPASSASIERIS